MNVSEAIAKLTPMGRAFMTQVGEGGFDFFDDGIVADSGNYGENLAQEMKCAKTTRSAGGIMAGTLKLGLWTVQDTTDGQGGATTWWALTPIGAVVANKLAGHEEYATDKEVEEMVAAADADPAMHAAPEMRVEIVADEQAQRVAGDLQDEKRYYDGSLAEVQKATERAVDHSSKGFRADASWIVQHATEAARHQARIETLVEIARYTSLTREQVALALSGERIWFQIG